MKAKAYSYIRFSTPEQLKGDSLRRQLDDSRDYANKHNLDLDESLQDLGTSAYHGLNRIKGALGRFLKLVDEGNIERGSYLIVENLDRLSREEVDDAYDQFRGIIKAGIIIVTLQDGMEYSRESIKANWAQLIISITYMARAWDESKRKSQRLRKKWQNKREKAISENKKITKKAPAWLKYSDEINDFVPFPGRSEIVEEIFDLMNNGNGMGYIARELESRTGIWKPKNGWIKSYVHKILTSRAVLGEFTPHLLIEKVRIAQRPMKDYYPRIISDELFYNVQKQIEAKGEVNGHCGGRTGKANNLFVQVVRCGLCKSPMHFIDKGTSPKGGQYLHCDFARRRKTCSAKSIRYNEFEQLFFDNFEELNISDLLPNKNEVVNKQNRLNSILTANQQKLIKLGEQKKNLKNTIKDTNDDRARREYDNDLIELLDEVDRLIVDNQKIKIDLKELDFGLSDLKNSIDTVKEVYDLFKACKDESDQIRLRLKLRTYIRKIVRSIEIYPLQEGYKPIEEVEPGVYKTMHSKYIDHVRIKFNGNNNSRTLWLKRGFDISDVV